MSDIPRQAVDRLRKLEAWAEDARAAYLDAQAACNERRVEITRLDAGLRQFSSGLPVEVDDAGRPFVRQGGAIGHVEAQAAVQTARELARLRRDLAGLTARRDEAGSRTQMFGQLASACRQELERRGWREGTHLSVTPGPAPIEDAMPIAAAIAGATARAGAAS